MYCDPPGPALGALKNASVYSSTLIAYFEPLKSCKFYDEITRLDTVALRRCVLNFDYSI